MDSHLGSFVKPIAVIPFDDTDLKVNWTFNEASGDIINKQTTGEGLGSSANIEITGATYGVTGKVGTALSFDGINDVGNVGTSVSQFNFLHNETALWSFVAWFKCNTLGVSEDFFNTTQGSPTNVGIVIQLIAGTPRPIRVGLTNGSAWQDVDSAGTGRVPNDTDFHFIIITYDFNEANEITFQVDNGTIESLPSTIAKTNNNSAFSMDICARQEASFGEMVVNQWAIFNRILTSDERTDLWNSGAGREIT